MMRTRGDEFAFRKGDLVAIIAVILIALALLAYFLIPKDGGKKVVAQVYLDGIMIDELPLDRDDEKNYTSLYHNTVTVREGKIAVTESDCPGEDCVHTGWARRSGMSIVCLPNRLEIRLVSTDGEDDVDMMVW